MKAKNDDRGDAPLPPALVAWLNREQRAMGDTLREEIDERLGGIERGIQQVSQGHGSWWQRYRVDVYAVVLAAALGWTLWQVHGLRRVGASESPPSASGSVVAARPAPSPTPPADTPPEPSATEASAAPRVLRFDPANPRDSWVDFVSAEPVASAAALREAAAGGGLAPNQVTERASTRLEGWAAAVASGPVDWNNDQVEASLATLFEFAARRMVEDHTPDAARPTGLVDGTIDAGEYPAATLATVLDRLGVREQVPDLEPTHKRLQSAVVIGWLEGRIGG